MAGYQHMPVDPALVKYGNMFTNRHKYFRWTRRTGGLTFVYVVAIPAAIGFIAYKYDGKWQMRGKRRGDPIAEW